MTSGESFETTSDERVMAALAHFFGLIAALLVWATQKDKSRFLRFQSLQALAFDALLMILSLVLTMCVMGVMLVGVIFEGFSVAQSASPPDSILTIGMASMLLPFGMFFCIMPLSLAALTVRIIAAISVAGGRNFRYPWIASRVDAFLGDRANTPA